MAVKEVRCCDVYPAKEAKPATLILTHDGAVALKCDGDLSQRALERLQKLIEKGFTEPSRNTAPSAT